MLRKPFTSADRVVSRATRAGVFDDVFGGVRYQFGNGGDLHGNRYYRHDVTRPQLSNEASQGRMISIYLQALLARVDHLPADTETTAAARDEVMAAGRGCPRRLTLSRGPRCTLDVVHGTGSCTAARGARVAIAPVPRYQVRDGPTLRDVIFARMGHIL